jgi:hypothetical protein
MDCNGHDGGGVTDYNGCEMIPVVVGGGRREGCSTGAFYGVGEMCGLALSSELLNSSRNHLLFARGR